MLRSTAAARLAATASPSRTIVARRIPLAARPTLRAQTIRRYASGAAATPPPPPPASTSGGGGGGGGGSGMYIVLAAIVALGAGGYYLLKPVSDVASAAHSTIKSVKEGGGNLGEQASSLTHAIAQAALPPGAFALFSHLSKQEGGINGFLTNLQDKDLSSVLDEIKKHGGDDVKRVTEKVEKRLKDAKGKAQDVDWKALAEDLKKELPESSQKYVDMFIGKIPGKEDVDQAIKKLKDIGEQKRKELEATASKILAEVKKAEKDGKDKTNALVNGFKKAAPGDLDSLVKQLKDAAKNAGLPADQIEAWLKHKAEDGKVNAEDAAVQIKDKLRTGAKWIPGEPKELVESVKQFSPSIAELLAQALKEAGIVDDKLNRKV